MRIGVKETPEIGEIISLHGPWIPSTVRCAGPTPGASSNRPGSL
ncbi:hypothetical protein ACX5I6_20210 [Arthrobacter sp. MMS24-T111]